MPVLISIADDHPMVIKGLENVLQDHPDIRILGTYATADALLAGLEAAVPDVLILDIHLPDKTADQIVPVLLEQYPGLSILTLTNADNALYLRNMLRLGVQGYILKTAGTEKLLAAISAVAKREMYIDEDLKDKMEDDRLRNKRETFLKAQLTDRELEILQLVVEGCTAQEIADRLFVSIKTVEYYRINLLLKLDARNTAALVSKALKQGLAH